MGATWNSCENKSRSYRVVITCNLLQMSLSIVKEIRKKVYCFLKYFAQMEHKVQCKVTIWSKLGL